MLETLRKQRQAQIIVVLFLMLTAFWILLQLGIYNGQILFNHSIHKFFGALYGFIALFGAIWGMGIAKQWGSTKSIVGKSLIFFSLGLLAQEFGQLSLSYLDYVFNIAGAYPSIGDVGYVGSIPLYIAGIYYLAQASGVKITFQLFFKKIQAILIPVAMLLLGYILFLQGYNFDWSNPVKIFLDFGYPFGQALYVSFALLAFLLSKNVLGGIMKNKVMFILIALCMQFLSDYTFLYQSSKGTWSVGGINDFMYLVSYFLMTFGLIQFRTVYEHLKAK